MIEPVPGQNLPNAKHSRKKVLFKCDCGNEKWIIWKNYNTNHTKSCGMCKSQKYSIDAIKNKKFGHLTVDIDTIKGKINSKSILTFICDCGNKKDIILKSVVNGLTKSCGCGLGRKPQNLIKYDKLPKEHWLKSDLPLNLIVNSDDLPEKWSKGSNKKFKWQCNCGREFYAPFNKIYSGHTKTCGKCDFIKKEFYLNKKFGKLKLLDNNLPDEFHKNTDAAFLFKCDCGNEKWISIHSIIKNNQKTCGECNVYSKSNLINEKFGHLTIIKINYDKIHKYSEKKVICKCSCGNIIEVKLCEITTGHKKTCGKCLSKSHEWHSKRGKLPDKVNGYYELNDLIKYFSGSFIEPLERIRNVYDKYKFKCKLCGNTYYTKLGYVLYNNVHCCGCINGNYSFASSEIGNFISKHIECLYGKNEKKIGNYSVDIFIPSLNIIIEYNGLIYHSDKFNKNKVDIDKYKELSKNYSYLMIFEDEWIKRRNCFKNLILNKIKKTNYKSLRPKDCKIELISNNEISQFYETYHYQGHCNSKYNIGVSYGDEIVACMSIKHPTRQNSGNWEISRMACSYKYKIHGIWSYLIKWIKRNNLISGKLITFSDNRLMNGKVYQIMGFEHVRNINPDYYWVKGRNRYHKSRLRKTDEEKLTGKTESQLRKEQGYHKIYDLGKKKWEIYI
ncbi:MAG: hypothetical protein ACOC3V_01295 [bacterium]